jgi:hypothetical protein
MCYHHDAANAWIKEHQFLVPLYTHSQSIGLLILRLIRKDNLSKLQQQYGSCVGVNMERVELQVGCMPYFK